MQNYQEKAIPLVLREEDHKYNVNPEAINFLKSIQGKLAIISVAGLYRTGKSFLLNTMLLNSKNGFAVGPTTNPKTKGIWIWGKPLIFKNQNDEIINVLVMDSQGLGSTDEDINHDLRLFSITLLLSSSFMYNTVGAIDQNAIDSLGLVLRLCEHLKNEKFNDFPDFYWILRDFSLALVDKDNNSLTPKMYLQSCLSAQPGDSQIRNKIRMTIKQAFKNRNLFTFIRPLLDQASLQNLENKPLEELRPEFVEQVLGFRKQIFNSLKIKSIKGRQVTGDMLGQLLCIYIQAINDDKIPVIESGWEQLCLKQLHEVLDEIEQAVSAKVRALKGNMPRCKKQLIEEQKKIMQEFEQIFKRRLINNHKAQQNFGKLKEIVGRQMKGIESQMKAMNTEQTQIFVKKQFESIEKRVKDAEFKSMGQLVKEFEIFYEYFRKKCPYKDDISTGMEVLFKKFSDSALIMCKSIQRRKNVEIDDLKADIQNLTVEMSTNEQKLKQEKNRAQNMTVILESKLQQLTRQNLHLVSVHENLQAKIEELQQKINESQEEDLINQNLEFKKKLLELQNKQNELICSHSHQISEFQQKITLQKNQIENLEKYKADLSMKLEEILSLNENAKNQSLAMNEKYVEETQKLEEEKKMMEVSLRERIAQLEVELRKVEAAFETKCEEIAQFTETQTKETSIILEKALNDKDLQISDKQQLIFNLTTELEQLKSQYEKSIQQLQSQLGTLQITHKNQIRQIQQNRALLEQKLSYIQNQCDEKAKKNKILLKENQNYVILFEEKDQKIEELLAEIEELKNYDEAESEQIEKKITEMASQLENRGNEIRRLEEENQRTKADLLRKTEDMKLLIEQNAIITQKLEEKNSKLQQKIEEIKKEHEQQEAKSQELLESAKNENQRYLNEQKRNSELSLVQLKNFYEMEKERLEKKLLEERRKYEFNEANRIMEVETKYKKIQRLQIEEINILKETKEEIEQKLHKLQNQYEIKMMNLGEEIENQRKIYENKFESLKKKYQQATEEYKRIQKQYEEQRLNFIKKIEGLNFQVSRKQKQIMQLNVKKQSLEASIIKKDGQIEGMRKNMHQEIQNSLKKVSETQNKCQKINEEYMHFKIDAEKQIALSKQKNEFLVARVNELTKQKQTGSMRNLEKLQKNKIIQLKDQLDKLKQENSTLQSKIENLRKNEKQSINGYKKQICELEKQNSTLHQKLEISESKIKELEIKSTEKYEALLKEIDEMRGKNQKERAKMQMELDARKNRINELDDQKNKITWEFQKDLALANDRVKFAEYHRDQNKRELEETEKRLQAALAQLKKSSDKSMIEESGIRRQSIDKRYTNQLQLVRMSSKVRQEQLQELTKKLKQETKHLKQKNIELHEKISRLQKNLQNQKNNSEQIQRLKREKDQLVLAHKSDSIKQNEEYKKKMMEYEKKNRDLERKNAEFIFIVEREKAKYNFEKQKLEERIKQLEEELNWLSGKFEKSNTQKSECLKGKQFSMTSSDVLGGWR